MQAIDTQDPRIAPDAAELTPDEFGRFCAEIREQPLWRREADKCADYYDGNQLDQETIAALEARGMGPLVVNLVQPTINVVLGMEAKMRSDWRVKADSDEWQDTAEALSQRLFEAERESRADRACSDAYAQQVKSGMGWCEISRESDPFKYPYRVKPVHRREIFWDWAAKEPDLSDARYLVRQRWYGIDQACSYLPQHADLIRAAGNGWTSQWLQKASENVDLAQSFDAERRISMSDWEWRNLDRETVSIFEVWYRRHVRGLVLRLQEGRAVEFDPQNMMHVAAVAAGKFKPEVAVFSKLRVALWIGPHKLQDMPVQSKRIPYVPFFGYREDLTGTPYGAIRAMLSPQDEINARRQKLLWLLSAKMVQVDSDALDRNYNDFSDLVKEVSRPDAVVVTNPQRRNPAGLNLHENMQVAPQQFQVMQEAEQSLQKAAGVFNAMMGRESSASSGMAINSLVEQGTTTLAELNDNYRYARRLVGEMLLDLIVDDLAGQEVQIVAGEGIRAKTVILNKPAIDPITGFEYRENDVTRAPVKVSLDDVPSTPAYRQQQQVMMGEVLKSLPPQAQAMMIPFYIEATDLPKRQEMADQLRKALGIQLDDNGQPPDPDKQQMQLALEQMQQAMQQGAAQYEQQLQQVTDQAQQSDAKLREALIGLRDRQSELALREQELAIKAQETQIKASSEQQKYDIERQKLHADMVAQSRDADMRMAENQATAEAAAMQPEMPEKDEGAELSKMQEMVTKAIEGLEKQIQAIANKPEPEAKEAQPMVINVQVDAKTGETKKSISVKRDGKGNIVGAEVEEK